MPHDLSPQTPPPGIRIADTRHDLDTAALAALLVPFEVHNRYPQLIRVHTKEFSAVCPGTGLPDVGSLDLQYVPNRMAVELKSLKYYLFAYRNLGIFQEPVADLMFGHLWELLHPRWLRLELVYNTRGGFDTTVTVEQGEALNAPPAEAYRL